MQSEVESSTGSLSPQSSARQDSVCTTGTGSGSMSVSQLPQPASVSPAAFSAQFVGDTPELEHRHISIPKALARHEARLVHYYALHLGRWLDCTDASRQFTLKIPALATTSPVLLEAIMSFAARHAGDTEAASLAHSRCIALLIVQLDSGRAAADDDALLCAIVILRVFEQLTAVGNGSDQERHLAGCSALLRACQGRPCVDPSAPSLRDAAFWVYMRQCLYNACINHQAPNVDFSLALLPVPGPAAGAAHALLSETAWANSMTWICATVVQFCFGSDAHEPSSRMAEWQDLSSAVEGWATSRPRSFDPIWQGEGSSGGGTRCFPEYYFAADWHIVAFGYYHLACMLLLLYKPAPQAPRFAIRSAHSGHQGQILQHARAMCGSCQSEPSNVPARIALCHSVFLWGALLDDASERGSLVQLLEELEHDHAWPTAWVVSALKEEWGI